jgi:hypothetical protein
LKAFKPAQFEGAEAKDITFPSGPGKTTTLKGASNISQLRAPDFTSMRDRPASCATTASKSARIFSG